MISRIAAVGIVVAGIVVAGIVVVVGVVVVGVVVGIVAEAGLALVFDKAFASSSVLDYCYYTDRNLDHYIDLCYYYFCTFIYLLKLAPPIFGIVSIVSSY